MTSRPILEPLAEQVTVGGRQFLSRRWAGQLRDGDRVRHGIFGNGTVLVCGLNYVGVKFDPDRLHPDGWEVWQPLSELEKV